MKDTLIRIQTHARNLIVGISKQQLQLRLIIPSNVVGQTFNLQFHPSFLELLLGTTIGWNPLLTLIVKWCVEWKRWKGECIISVIVRHGRHQRRVTGIHSRTRNASFIDIACPHKGTGHQSHQDDSCRHSRLLKKIAACNTLHVPTCGGSLGSFSHNIRDSIRGHLSGLHGHLLLDDIGIGIALRVAIGIHLLLL